MSALGVILAGGLARRMGGGDKALVELAGRPLLAHAIERLAPQVDRIVINANGDPARLDSFRLPVVADSVEGFAGPLAGVLTGLEWAAANAPECAWVASVAVDAPFFPADLVARFVAAVEAEGADMACAASNGRAHPVFGLWPVRLAGDLRRALVEQDVRKVDAWTARYSLAEAVFPAPVVDPFLNINRPEDLAAAGKIMADLNGSNRHADVN
jgi:molybdopterin-guanine dinucleotide biosynthesis protein A